MFDRLRLGAVATAIVVAALVTVALVFGNTGHKQKHTSAAHPSAAASKPAASHAPNAPDAQPGITTATSVPKGASSSSPLVTADPYRLGKLPRCNTTPPEVNAAKAPTSWKKTKLTNPSVLAKNVVTLLQAVYTERYNDTHLCRVTRVEKTHLVAGKWAYGGMDLSVSTGTADDLRRISNKVNIIGTVLTDQMSIHVVTPTDVYVFAPVQIGADGYGSSLFKTGSTWIYIGGTWLLNDISVGSDS